MSSGAEAVGICNRETPAVLKNRFANEKIGKNEKSVIGLSAVHTLLWIEGWGEETNGLNDPFGNPRIT